MKLNKNSWHYKVWEDTFSAFEVAPDNIDLCRYCHRIFWRLVLYAALAIMLAMCVGVLGYAVIYKGLVLNTIITLEIMGGIAVVGTLIILYVRWVTGRPSSLEPKTLVGKYAHAVKAGVCPLVEFTEDSDLH